jgi:soluble lytic murein transglycosylase
MVIRKSLIPRARRAAAPTVTGLVALLWALAFSCIAPAAHATATPATPVDPVILEFRAALQRIRRHEAEPNDSPALQSFVIHDYLVAARLRRDLTASPGEEQDRAVDEFLRAHPGQPVTFALKHDWLLSLADRKRWDLFLPRSLDVNDAQLICDRLTGRLAVGGTAGLAQDALARWILPQRQPEECGAVFAWLHTQAVLTPELAENRTRAALAADNPRLARDFVVDVPAPGSAPLLQWIQLLESPAAGVALLAINPGTPVEPDALIAGFTRLSIADSAAASRLLPTLLARPGLTPSAQTRLRRAAALGAAYARAPDAVAAFAAVTADPSDVQVHEWRARAALWAGDYSQALTWIGAMPANLAVQPRWRYWRARALAATAGDAAAAAAFGELAGMRDYYGYLAADRLGGNYNLNIHPSPDDLDAQTALSQQPGLIRAHALFDCDMADEAGVEWALVVGSAAPVVKIQAAHLASRWGWYAQTIAVLAQAGEWDDVPLRYPRPYAAVVAQAADAAGVSGDWLFAIMRQESLFRKDAVSRADARGLMQMQPATAAAVARRWHLPPPARDDLFDPSVALRLGADHVHELLEKYRGQLAPSLAAYNAGPNSVSRWLPPRPLDADVWIENIPYTETRGYIQHILEHIVAFATMRGAQPPRLTDLLPQIEPSARAP